MSGADGVEIRGLRKSFPTRSGLLGLLRSRPRRVALDGLDLSVERGTTIVLLGRNGAGKTTLLRTIAGLLSPDAGTLRLDGRDVTTRADLRRDRTSLVLADDRSFFLRLSVAENLRFFAVLAGIGGAEVGRRIERALDRVGLADRARDPFHVLSSGYRQRVAIARGLLREPEFLLLDEPTRSLDDDATDAVHRILGEFVAEDRRRAVVLATHRREDPAKLGARSVEIVPPDERIAP